MLSFICMFFHFHDFATQSDIPSLLAFNEKKRQKHVYGYGSKRTDLVVDVYGAVLGFTSPSFTKKGDWMITVTLIDESTPALEEASTGTDAGSKSISHITMIIFTSDKKKLPQISCAGDILRAHRVVAQASKVSEYNLCLIAEITEKYHVDRFENLSLIATTLPCYIILFIT